MDGASSRQSTHWAPAQIDRSRKPGRGEHGERAAARVAESSPPRAVSGPSGERLQVRPVVRVGVGQDHGADAGRVGPLLELGERARAGIEHDRVPAACTR